MEAAEWRQRSGGSGMEAEEAEESKRRKGGGGGGKEAKGVERRRRRCMEHGMTAVWQTSSSMAAGKAAAACAHLMTITRSGEDEEGFAATSPVEAVVSVECGDTLLSGRELLEQFVLRVEAHLICDLRGRGRGRRR